jgi:hypothetical protein
MMKAICEVKPKEKIGLAINIPNFEIGFNALVTIDWSEDIRPNFEKKREQNRKFTKYN